MSTPLEAVAELLADRAIEFVSDGVSKLLEDADYEVAVAAHSVMHGLSALVEVGLAELVAAAMTTTMVSDTVTFHDHSSPDEE